MSRGKLYRDPANGWVAGVCAGFAQYFDWNVKLVRAILVIAVICGSGFPIFVYLVAWYVMDPVPDGGYARRAANGSGPAYGGPTASMTDVKARFARLDERLRHIEECVTSDEFELRQEFKKLES
jgi:phage shock protein C